MENRKAMETKADIINKIATLRERVCDLETAIKNGRKLTPFGIWLYNEDKKDMKNQEDKLNKLFDNSYNSL